MNQRTALISALKEVPNEIGLGEDQRGDRGPDGNHADRHHPPAISRAWV
jgi:hypothetical protein